MNLRDSVLIQRNAICGEDLHFLSNFARKAEMTDSLVSNFADDAPEDRVEWVVDKRVRHTQELKLPDALRARLRRIDDASISRFVNPFFGVEVCEREPSQILHYGAGGHYIPHVDAETLYKDEEGRDFWEKTLERDLSIVYFLNEDFAGGELVFPDLDLVVRPEAGSLICFPSDHNFIHGVNPVSSGHRYTIVTWLRVANVPDLETINQTWMEEYQRRWPDPIKQPPRVFMR